MKRYIPVSRVEGTASRQAHCDLPQGTYEREMSKEGFFGPAAFFHHRHPPTGWTDFTGPLQPHAFDLTKLPVGGCSPWSAAQLLANPHCRIRYWRLASSMPRLARNADGDELLFVRAGRVIARGAGAELRAQAGMDDLEAAFLAFAGDGEVAA